MQITKLESISQENIIFDEARDFKVKESKFKYQRIKYRNGKEGPLIFFSVLVLMSFLDIQYRSVYGRKIVNKIKMKNHFLIQ